jgi:tetratricopeptide (TPR) repeat protein
VSGTDAASPHGDSPCTRPLRARLVLGGLLAVSTILAYAGLRDHEFVNFDDNVFIYENPYLTLGLGFEGLRWAGTSFYAANWLPLTWLTLLADHALWGLDPVGYHLTNLALHVGSTLLLFGALARMTGQGARSAFVAGVFALHPLHVESVAWASERKDVLAGLFFMLTLFAYASYAERRTAARYACVFLAMALGLLAKATLVTLPFVLLLLDVWPLGRVRRARAHGGFMPLVLEKLPLLALSLASSAVTYVAQRSGGALQLALPLGSRLENALVAYAAYLQKALWPQELVFFYPHPGDGLTVGQVGLALVVVSVICVVVGLAARRVPALPVGWLWYVGTLVPMIGIVQVGDQAMADRYTYLPLVGVAVAVAWGSGALGERYPWLRRSLAISGVLVLTAYGLATTRQVAVWRDDTSLYEHALRVLPDNYMAHYNLGRTLVKAQRFADAEPHLREAVRQRPDWADPRANLGVALLAVGAADEAVIHLGAASRAGLADPVVRVHLARAHLERGSLRAARRVLKELLLVQPGAAAVSLLLARVELADGRPDAALEVFLAVHRDVPDWPADPEARSLAAGILDALARQPEVSSEQLAAAAELEAALDRTDELPE